MLGFSLNVSVFFHEILDLPVEARNIAKQALDSAYHVRTSISGLILWTDDMHKREISRSSTSILRIESHEEDSHCIYLM
ncbi:hypothetical protein LIER_43745 [Lithospermum erythrorhizon]|uniref:Uncharacterized protein n=1 Tax=Lithospermum erythrorhizon TaxID=34254 RepID=A0AAV3QVL4_LITER